MLPSLISSLFFLLSFSSVAFVLPSCSILRLAFIIPSLKTPLVGPFGTSYHGSAKGEGGESDGNTTYFITLAIGHSSLCLQVRRYLLRQIN